MSPEEAKFIILDEVAIIRKRRKEAPSPEGDEAMAELEEALRTLGIVDITNKPK